MPIVSGTTRERLIRAAATTFLAVVIGVWFGYDGFVDYPRENWDYIRSNYLAQPPDSPTTLPVPDPDIGPHTPESLSAATLPDLEEQLGPAHFRTEDRALWIGAGWGALIASLDPAGNITALNWDRAKHTATDILWQKILCGFCLAVGLVLLVHLARLLRFRVSLDEAGLHIGATSVPWDRMRALDISAFKNKGWVELEYDCEGQPARLRLDSYHIDRFDDIIREICTRRGFTSPLPPDKTAPA